MNNEPPNIEQYPATDAVLLPGQDIPGRALLRLKIFALAFLGVAGIGLVYTFAQPTIYQSQATLLVSARTSVGQTNSEAVAQQIANQPQALFNSELIAKSRAGLAAAGYSVVSASDIKRHLSVQAVAGTSLLEIIAEGSDAELLPRIINTWIDVYLEAQVADIEANPAETEQLVPDELAQLELKLEQARAGLDEFRESKGITSPDWDENERKARLKELQGSLKSAIKQEEKTKAALEDVQHDIARGDTVIPRGELREINRLEQKLDKLETKLADLDDRYTRQFLALQPKLRVLPEQIEELEAEIESLWTAGNQRVLDDARQEHTAARKSVTELQRQIDELKQRAREFTSIAAEHSARVKALENLEDLHRETRARLTQIGTLRADELPQLSVITRATVSDTPIGTAVSRNAMISLSAALAASLFAVWLYGFLNPTHALHPATSVANVPLLRRSSDGALSEPGQDAESVDENQLTLGLQPADGQHPSTDQADEPERS